MNIKNYLFILILLFISVKNLFGQISYKLNQNQENQIVVNYSNPKTYEIGRIDVLGSKYLDKIALISISGLKIGDQITIPGDAISGAIKKLWKQGIIGDIQIYASKIEGNKVDLTIKLTERARLSKFKIEGLGKSNTTTLNEKINLIRGRIVTDAVLKNTKNTIKKYLDNKGYTNASISIKQEIDTILSNSIRLIINVNKKQKVKINNINFNGNVIFSDAKLKSKLKKTGEKPRVGLFKSIFYNSIELLKPKKLFGNKKGLDLVRFNKYLTDNLKINVFKSSKFITLEYRNDKENLIKFYQSKGYRDIKIISDSTYFDKNNLININLGVNPGNKYFFRNISWAGNYIYDNKTLSEVLGIDKGDVYDTETLEKKITYNPKGEDVSSLYQDNGYLFSNIQPIEVSIENDSVDIEMRIYEGAQATIDKVTVIGNDRTSDHVIMRELRTIPGQKYNRSELIRTQRELSQLGYFDPENITPVPTPNPAKETVDIRWEVEEKPSDQVELSGGWGGYFGFVGTVGLSFSNFSVKNITDFSKWKPLPVGDGQKLSIRVQANGRQFQTYSFSFSEPWFGGSRPNNFGINYSYSINRMLDFYGTGYPYGGGYGGY